MREIKFKLWNPHGKSMIEDVENVYDCLKQQHVHDKTQPSRGFTPAYDHVSEGFVWLQFTGVKDKKGRDIYEGDIVKYSLDNPDGDSQTFIEEVIFHGSCFVVDGYTPLDVTIDWEVEVIGNVHENPELIQG
jgi:uncharacterized phage protein (TIGR01671 family)